MTRSVFAYLGPVFSALLGEYDAFGLETEVVVAIDLVLDGVGGGFCVCELSALSGTDGGAKK